MRDAQVFKILHVITSESDDFFWFLGMYYVFYVSVSDWYYFYPGEVSWKWIF